MLIPVSCVNSRMTKNLTVKLNSGYTMPLVGLGTWKSKANKVSEAVLVAIQSGYRHIDCASDYENEAEVGSGILNAVSSGIVDRKDMFITSKLWNTFHQPEDVRPAFMSSLSKLNCSYIDLYLMHYPTGENENGKTCVSDIDYVVTWKAMELLLKDGLVKSIGVSNFNLFQLNRILKECSIVPAVNQIENHPYLTEEKMINFCQSRNIHVTAYSPLGSLDREWASAGDPSLFQDQKLIELAKAYNKSVAQLVLRFQLQRGLSVIPKSINSEHIQDNINVFDFEISIDDIKTISSLNKNWRAMDVSWIKGNKYFPFCDDYHEK